LTRNRSTVKSMVLACLFLAGRNGHAAEPGQRECLEANESSIRARLDHKLLASREAALVCSQPSCPHEVQTACQDRLTQLSVAIPTLVFEAKDESGNDLSDVVVTVDGQPFAARLDGTPVAVDPGEHTFEFAAPGRAKRTKRLVVYQGETNRRERLDLGRVFGPPSIPRRSDASSPSSSRGLGAQRITGLSLEGLGIAGVGAGSAFGLIAHSAWSSVTAACGAGGPTHCASANHASLESDRSTALTDGTISTIAFVAGGAFLVAGAMVFFTAIPHRERSSASTWSIASGVGWGSWTLRGEF
jgi:hypothetical protein